VIQLGLFEGRQRRDRGLAKVSRDYGWWLDQARTVAEEIANRRGEVNSDDVHELCPLPIGAHHNLMGAVFKDARFKPIGYIASTRPSAHGRIIRIYCLNQ
jgi:hypothetical protein